MVTYQRNMAHDRNSFKSALMQHLGGALGEFYKARLATKNGETRWVLHWMREAIDLVERAAEVYADHEVRGFKDRSRALSEVIAHIEHRDRSYRTRATHTVLADFHRKRIPRKLTDEDTTEFWLMVSRNVR